MIRSRDRGRPVLSQQVQLRQEDPHAPSKPAFVLFLPVYGQGRPTTTVPERRASLRGFVYGAFRVQDVMASTYGS